MRFIKNRKVVNKKPLKQVKVVKDFFSCKTYEDYKEYLISKYGKVEADDKWQTLICYEAKVVVLFGDYLKFDKFIFYDYHEDDIDEDEDRLIPTYFTNSASLKTIYWYNGIDSKREHTFKVGDPYFRLGYRIKALFNYGVKERMRKENESFIIKYGTPDKSTESGMLLFIKAGHLIVRQKDANGVLENVDIDLDRLTVYSLHEKQEKITNTDADGFSEEITTFKLDGSGLSLEINWTKIIEDKYDTFSIYGHDAKTVKAWLDELFLNKQWRSYPVMLNVIYDATRSDPKAMYVSDQTFKAMFTSREIKQVRLDMFQGKDYSSVRTLDHRLRTQIMTYFKYTLRMMDCDPLWISYKWAQEEREKLHVDNIRYLNVDDILRMQMLVKRKGKGLSREELLRGLEDCCIYKEVWTRETGHLWEKYSLLRREPSKEEFDYADTWNDYPVWLTDCSMEWILENLEKYVIK